VATLCTASSLADDAEVVVEDEFADDATTALAGEVVRLAITAPMLEAVRGGGRPASPVRCAMRVEPGEVIVTMTAEGRRVAMPEDVADVVRQAGIHWNDEGQDAGTLSLAFPRA